MAEDHLFNVSKFMDHVVWTPGWLSNGHFAARKPRVKLGAHMTSTDAVRCAFPKAVQITEWEDAKIIEALALKIFTLFGPAPMFAKDGEKPAPYFDAPTIEEASVVIMPMTVPVDWDQVARTVAAATTEEPQAGALVEMPPVDAHADAVAEAFMDALEDPNSEAAALFTQVVDEHGGSVSFTTGNRTASFGDQAETPSI